VAILILARYRGLRCGKVDPTFRAFTARCLTQFFWNAFLVLVGHFEGASRLIIASVIVWTSVMVEVWRPNPTTMTTAVGK